MKHLKLFKESLKITKDEVDDIRDMFLDIADEYNLTYINFKNYRDQTIRGAVANWAQLVRDMSLKTDSYSLVYDLAYNQGREVTLLIYLGNNDILNSKFKNDLSNFFKRLRSLDYGIKVATIQEFLGDKFATFDIFKNN